MSKHEQIFLQKIYKLIQSQAIDKYEFHSFEEAAVLIFQNLADDLTHIVEIYERFTFEISASIVSLTDKRLEEKNKEFLEKLVQYVDGIDRMFNKRAVEFGKLCKKASDLHTVSSNELLDRKNLLYEIAKQEKSFDAAIQRVLRFSRKQMLEAKKRNITHLHKYAYQFTQIKLFESLDLDKAFSLIVEKGKIV
jgi:alpha-N-acetylglucosamine transferase